MYAVLAVVLVVAAGAVEVVLLNQPTATGPSITLVAFNGTQRNVTLSEMLGMEAVERYGSFQNSYGNVRGQGNYTGVLIADLIELIGGMEADQVIIVIAEDEYQQYFTYSNLYPNTTQYSIQGDFVLAYSLNGTTIPDFEDGPRLMFLPADGYYSNDDGVLTIDPQFYSGSAGPKLVSNVAKIVIAERPVAPEEEILSVTVGGVTEGYTLSEIVEFGAINGTGGTKNRYGTLKGPYNFTGVAVLDLLADTGALPDNYNLSCLSSDDNEVIYNKTTTEGAVYGYEPGTGDSVGIVESTMVLAYLQNGAPIDPDGPLRVVFLNDYGYFTDSYLWAKMVVNLTVIEIGPDVLFINRGNSTLAHNLAEVMAMPSFSGDGGYKKSSGTLVGPNAYTGVTVEYLLSLTEVPLVNSSIEVISTDFYTTYYNMTQIEGWYAAYNDTTGESAGVQFFTMVLAYERDGLLLTDDGPFRIVLLNEEGYFSDGHFWAKLVTNITVVDSVESWTLELEGVDPYNMTHDTYYSLASCPHHRIVISTEGHTYWGVALWVLVAAMDGGDDTHFSFNVTLAISGYSVRLYDEIGNNVSFTAAQLAQNGSIIVAGWVDGLLPGTPDWPLILVTPDGPLLSNIVRIEMLLS